MNPQERVERAMAAVTAGRPLGFSTLDELDTVCREHGAVRDGDRWGRWTWHAPSRVLSIDADGAYEIDLDRCTSPMSDLDWILHLAGKTWATNADVGALVRALRAIRGRPR
jgi:hypothetical protein